GALIESDAAQELLVRLLEEAADREAGEAGTIEGVEGIGRRLEEEALRLRGVMQKRERELNAARVDRRRTTLEATMTARIKSAERRLETLKSRQAPEFPIRMAQARVERAQHERSMALRDLDQRGDVVIEIEQLAIGRLLVE